MSYSTRFDEALVFASDLHRTQIRKGKSVPYITHLLAVASLVGAHGGTEEQAIAALLHDAIEDCIDDVPNIRAQIQNRFGQDVLDMVEACTDADVHPKPEWWTRKQAYLNHLRAVSDEDPALIVSLADKVHNSSALVSDVRRHGAALWDRFNGKHLGSLWYYESLARIFAEKKPGELAFELDRAVSEIYRLGGEPKMRTLNHEEDIHLVLASTPGDVPTETYELLIVERPSPPVRLADIHVRELRLHASVRASEPGEPVADFNRQARQVLGTELRDWHESGAAPDDGAFLAATHRHRPLGDDGAFVSIALVGHVVALQELERVVEWLDYAHR